MRPQLHPSWNIFFDLLGEFAHKYGGSIYDCEARKTWDPGQFACRLVYGPNWNDDPRFQQDDALSDEEPVPRNTIELMQDVIANGLPVWAKIV